jgi:hypothetical protein
MSGMPVTYRVRRAAQLSDVRLLDILVWQTWRK